MKDMSAVRSFFEHTLHRKERQGKFRMKRRNAKELRPGEWLVFSYEGDIVYLATAKSDVDEEGEGYCFYIDLDTIIEVEGRRLHELEDELRVRRIYDKNIATSQGWNSIPIDDEIAKEVLQKFAN